MTYLENHLIDGKKRIYFQWVWVVMAIIKPPLMVRASNEDLNSTLMAIVHRGLFCMPHLL